MKPKYIVLHHSLTKDSETVSWGAIRNYHVNTLGWRDIGYHYGIENLRGQAEALVGRMWYERGAHCRDNHMNDLSLGICFVGNFDVDPVPDDQWNVGVRLVGSLCLIHGIPVERIYGHSYFTNRKTCPGELFSVTQFREDVLELVVRESKTM